MSGTNPRVREELADHYGRLRMEDAVSFLYLIKYKFRPQPQMYRYFLVTMEEYKRRYIDAPEVIARVNSLLRDHPDLIVAFGGFLPHGYRVEAKIVASDDQSENQSEIEE